jgi:hypothetical protein
MKCITIAAFAAILLAEQASGFVQTAAISKTHGVISLRGLHGRAAAVVQPASCTHGHMCMAMRRVAPTRLSTALGAAKRDAQSEDESVTAPDRSNYRFIGFAKVWLAFVIYAFLLAPGHNPAAEAIDKVSSC